MAGFISASIEGLDSLQLEFEEKFMRKVNEGVRYASYALVADMPFMLQEHIQNDVYAQYEPKEYERRSENPSYGTPLDAEEQINAQVKYVGEGYSVVRLDYNPTGRHALYDESLEGDELIKVLSYGQGYLWDVDEEAIGPRPFWDNFVQELIEGGEAEDILVRVINQAYGLRAVAQKGSTVRDANDTKF